MVEGGRMLTSRNRGGGGGLAPRAGEDEVLYNVVRDWLVHFFAIVAARYVTEDGKTGSKWSENARIGCKKGAGADKAPDGGSGGARWFWWRKRRHESEVGSLFDHAMSAVLRAAAREEVYAVCLSQLRWSVLRSMDRGRRRLRPV
jgi:hypothetical protein